MKTFARLIVRRSVAWVVVLVVFGLTLACGLYASRVVQDDDVLAFLPQGNPEVASFNGVAERFGSMDVALVGIEARGEVFDPDFVQRLKQLTKRLNETQGIQYALSLTSVEDFTPDPERGGVSTDYLVREVPTDPASVLALREKVMSRDAVVGNLVSADGRAVMIYCFAVPGTQPRVTADRVRTEVEAIFPGEKKYWGGAPFVATYIYDVTQADLRKLAPWACLAIALIVLLSFRDLVGTGLSLLSTILGIVIPLGLMGMLGVHTNIVLGSMPVILFALGSAYGVHLLSRFFALLPTMPRHEALERAILQVGPSILGSGITTVFGTLSFIMMDIEPMRTFGIFTSVGLTFALVLAMTFIPAVLVLVPIKGKPEATIPWLARAMGKFAVLAAERKVAVGVLVGAITLVATFYTTRVDSRMDTTAFFDAGSPPAEADAFMRRHFGGSQFIQVEVEGDMNDPAVLRHVQLLADRIAVTPGVSSVTHIGAIIGLTNEAMEDVRRIPDTTEKVRLLHSFLTGKTAVSSTITEDRKRALITVKVVPSAAVDVEPVLIEVEAVVRGLPANVVVATRAGPRAEEVSEAQVAIVSAHIRALARTAGSAVPDRVALEAALRTKAVEADPAEIEKLITKFVRSEAFGVTLGPDLGADAPERIARAVVALGAPEAGEAGVKAYRAKIPDAVAGALGKPVEDPIVDDGALALEQNAGEMWTQARARTQAARILEASGISPTADGAHIGRFRVAVAHALLDLEAPSAALPAAGDPSAVELGTVVTGLPVLYRGLGKSVFSNQWSSLWFALAAVIVLKAMLFRSASAGLLTSAPTFVTLLLLYGGMGHMGLHLDIGTSMLASLIIGAGDDYAVQYLWSWSAPTDRPPALSEAARSAAYDTGPGIWTNAIMVAAGFFVLTLGDARPLKNVGMLTSVAMLAAALATFVVVPLLARRTKYAPQYFEPEPVQPEPAVLSRDSERPTETI